MIPHCLQFAYVRATSKVRSSQVRGSCQSFGSRDVKSPSIGADGLNPEFGTVALACTKGTAFQASLSLWSCGWFQETPLGPARNDYCGGVCDSDAVDDFALRSKLTPCTSHTVNCRP